MPDWIGLAKERRRVGDFEEWKNCKGKSQGFKKVNLHFYNKFILICFCLLKIAVVLIFPLCYKYYYTEFHRVFHSVT